MTCVNVGGNMEITYKRPDELTPYENNTKVHPPEQVDRIAESIKRFGWQQPIAVDRENVVIIGHGRLMAAKQLMLDTVPVVYADNLTEDEAQALRLADNKTNESPWDFGKLEEELAALSIAGIDMTAFGFDDLEKQIDAPEAQEEKKGSMAGKYLVPPFSILYANKPDWLARKRSWVEKGLHSEIGRGDKLAYNSKRDPEDNFARGKAKAYSDGLIQKGK